MGEAAEAERAAAAVNETEEIDLAALIRERGADGAEAALIASGWDARSAAEAVALELGEGDDGWDLSK